MASALLGGLEIAVHAMYPDITAIVNTPAVTKGSSRGSRGRRKPRKKSQTRSSAAQQTPTPERFKPPQALRHSVTRTTTVPHTSKDRINATRITVLIAG
jgi:hypothetical protein